MAIYTGSWPRGPTFTHDDERLVYDITMDLHSSRSLSTINYNRGMAMFGEQKMVELVGAIGFYSMVGMTLNAFDVAMPEDKKPMD